MKQHILVSALDWGYGHVTRTNIRVNHFLQSGNKITIACSQNQFDLWSQLQPELEIIPELPDNKIELKGISFEMLFLAKRNKQFQRNWKAESLWTNEFIKNNSVDLIYSDNRYGFFSSHVPSILLTHQLSLQGPWPWRNIAQWALNKRLSNFNRIEIPDFENTPRLAGKLSTSSNLNVTFVGPLTPEFHDNSAFNYNCEHVLFLSGPEPQRSQLAQLIHDLWPNEFNLHIVGHCNIKLEKLNVHLLGFLNTQDKLTVLKQAKLIITRSGYTTLMELHGLNKKAILIPTQGQWEQEYLGMYWNVQFHFPCIDQQHLSTEYLISQLKSQS